MKKIASIVFGLLTLMLISGVQAYVINFEVPTEINLGENIVIEGTSSINPGMTMTICLYTQDVQIVEIGCYPFTVQSGGTWAVTVPTEGLKSGRYKLEVKENSDVSLGGSSTRYCQFTIVDRSSEIMITSPTTQAFTGTLKVSGRSTTRGNAGIEIMVEDEYGDIVYPYSWITTNTAGIFSEDIPLSSAGMYYVNFYDNKGYVTSVKFMVTPSSSTSQTTSPTSSGTKAPTSAVKPVSAQTLASTASPAYFEIETVSGILNVETSAGNHDWILEYADETGLVSKINRYGSGSAESFAIPVSGGKVYLKIYPADSSDSGYVTVFATGAKSVTVNANSASKFASPTPTSKQSGNPIIVVLLSMAAVGIVMRLRK